MSCGGVPRARCTARRPPPGAVRARHAALVYGAREPFRGRAALVRPRLEFGRPGQIQVWLLSDTACVVTSHRSPLGRAGEPIEKGGLAYATGGPLTRGQGPRRARFFPSVNDLGALFGEQRRRDASSVASRFPSTEPRGVVPTRSSAQRKERCRARGPLDNGSRTAPGETMSRGLHIGATAQHPFGPLPTHLSS